MIQISHMMPVLTFRKSKVHRVKSSIEGLLAIELSKEETKASMGAVGK